jgi:hypothetical protein
VFFGSDQLHLWCPRHRAREYSGYTPLKREDIPSSSPISCVPCPLVHVPPQRFCFAGTGSPPTHHYTAYLPLCLAHPLTIRYNDDLSLEDAIHTALLTLKEGFEGQMTEHTIEIGVVTVPTAEQMQEKPGERLPPTFRKLSEQEVRDYLAL